MSANTEPYDPYIPNKAGGPPSKAQRVQAQVDEVVGIMQENIDKVVDRGARLDDMREQTEGLSNTASQFRRGANQVRKRMWWKDMKMRLIIAAAILVLILIIVVPVVLKSQSPSPSAAATPTPPPVAATLTSLVASPTST